MNMPHFSGFAKLIIPSDKHSGGATEAAAPEFIDLLTSENDDFQRQFRGGILWLNATCQHRYDNIYFQCSAAQQKEILDLIAYKANGEKDSSFMPGINFFALLRQLTVNRNLLPGIHWQYFLSRIFRLPVAPRLNRNYSSFWQHLACHPEQ